MILALDAGHGLPDSGAVGCGLLEYQVAMRIVQQVKPIIERHGVKVVLTRTNDKIVALNERCRIANDANANLFVSIHLNAADKKAHGYETLTYKQRPEATMMHAEMMNYLKRFGVTDRGIKERPGLAVLAGTYMPALLLENLFIDNESDMKLMKQESFFNGLCEAIARGILRVLGVTYIPQKPAPQPAGTLHTVQIGAFNDKANADKLAAELKAKGYNPIVKEVK
jgi:N-acetylmuramoyl-L-alanine amidase